MNQIEMKNKILSDYNAGANLKWKASERLAIYFYPEETVTSEGNPAHKFYTAELLSNGSLKIIENYFLYNRTYKNKFTGKSKKGTIYRIGSDLNSVSEYYNRKNDSDGSRYALLLENLRGVRYVVNHPTTSKTTPFAYKVQE